MTKADERDFLEFVRGTEDVVVLPNASSHRDFQPVGSLPEPFAERSWRHFWLYNRNVSSNLKVRFVDKEGCYVIDRLSSSVIEFSRSSMEGQVMRRGRIWADFTYFDREKRLVLRKEPDFQRWYETIARWIRKRYKHVDRIIYAGPGAQRLLAEGNIFDIDVKPVPTSQAAGGKS